MAAFQEYPGLRDPLREELLGGILPNLLSGGPAGLPVDSENSIRTASSLVLQMLQVQPCLCLALISSCGIRVRACFSYHRAADEQHQ